ncbi:MAG: sigma-70 family RNA polymerase sigma factor [Nitriliruptoraceae bacterium]|nr:sigma-70 family RNA polymerase sigma factor [Nitriliruptoraceae bacterium]
MMQTPPPTPDGFEDAFDPLFRRAFLVARRILGDPTSAEDVAAEAMARAFAHWSRIGDRPWREGWVVRVATNLAIDVARRGSRVSDRPTEPDTVTVDDHTDEVVVLRLTLVAALRRLPRRQREAVSLRYLAGLSEAQVAEAMQVSAGSVKTHLHRGVQRLRARLGEDVDRRLEVVGR